MHTYLCRTSRDVIPFQHAGTVEDCPVCGAVAPVDSSQDSGEVAKLREYIELLENQVVAMMAEPEDKPVPFLPVDPEEQRRFQIAASDGRRSMVYGSNS